MPRAAGCSARATLTTGTCGSYGAFTTVTGGTNPSSPFTDTSVTSGGCYQYRYLVSDNLSNQGTITSANVVKVDTSAPSAPTLAFSALTSTYTSANTVYYRSTASSGAFTVTASSTDADSGVAGYAFPTLPAGWSASPGSLGVNTYSWIAANPTAPSGAQNISSTNNAALTSAVTGMTLTADNAAPTGSITCADGYYTATSVSVTFTPADGGGSGVNAAAGGFLQRSDGTLTSSSGACSGYGAYATVTGGTNPTSPFIDGSVTDGHCYKYQYVVSDNLAQQGTITSASVAKVDTTAPLAPSSMTVTSGGPVIGSATCGVAANTRYINAQTSVSMSATIALPETGESVLFSATSSAPSPVTVSATGSVTSGTATATLDLELRFLGEGTITVTARAVDAAGNQSATTKGPTNTIIKDTVVPALVANYSPTGGGIVNLSPRVYGTSECGAFVSAQKTTGGSPDTTTIASGTSYEIVVGLLALGSAYYDVTSTDLAGNTHAAIRVP